MAQNNNKSRFLSILLSALMMVTPIHSAIALEESVSVPPPPTSVEETISTPTTEEGSTTSNNESTTAEDSSNVESAPVENAKPTEDEAIGENLVELTEEMTANEDTMVAFRNVGTTGTIDGNNIETLTAKWITEDTVDNGRPELLTLALEDNKPFFARVKVNFALSGQEGYEPGQLSLKVPKQIFRDRNGNKTGRLTLAVPEAPDRTAQFAYIDEGETYNLVNVRTLKAASSGTFEFTYTELTPSTLKDKVTGTKTLPFTAILKILKDGKEVKKESNALLAEVDTHARIMGAQKESQDGAIAEYPEDWSTEFKPDNHTDYVYVRYTISANINANQPFKVKIKDEPTQATGDTPIILGFRDVTSGVTDTPKTRTFEKEIFEGYKEASSYGDFYGYVYVAYPNRNMKNRGQSYQLSNKITYTLTSLDDQEITTAVANHSVTYRPILFEKPEGHFYTDKAGSDLGATTHWTEPKRIPRYATAVNALLKDTDVDIEYSVHTRGFGYKWTRTEDSDENDETVYSRVPYTMMYEDRGLTLLDGPTLTPGEDYTFKSLKFHDERVFDYGKYKKTSYGYFENERRVIEFGRITQGHYGYQESKDYNEVVKVFATVNGIKTQVAQVNFDSGFITINPMNGATADYDVLTFPQGTTEYKVETETLKPAFMFYTRPVFTIKPTNKIKEHIKSTSRAGSHRVNLHFENKTRMDVILYGSKGLINEDFARVVLTPFLYGSNLTKSSTFENDVKRKVVNIDYTSTMTKMFNTSKETDLEKARELNIYKEETEQTWYDLLPIGVSPLLSTIKIKNGTVLSSKILDNYKNSGRKLLIVKTRVDKPDYRYSVENESLYEEVELSFRTSYLWDAYKAYGDRLKNHIAYETSNQELGNRINEKGEKDTPANRENRFTPNFDTTTVNLLADLNKAHNNPTFLYAEDSNRIYADIFAISSVEKTVDVNNEANYGDGLFDELAKNVYEKGVYNYKIAVTNTDSTKTKDIIFYDNLEKYVPTADKPDYNDIIWKGTFLGVDVSSLEAKGVAPKVYYSTRDDLTLDDTDNRAHNNLNDRSIWSTTPPQDLSKVKAIAVDATTTKQGASFELPQNDIAYFTIKMRAPRVRDVFPDGQTNPTPYYDKELGHDNEAGITGGAHAYNNAVMIATSVEVDSGRTSDHLLIRNDYTKVGLRPNNWTVKKVFNDDNNRDGIRPAEVTIHLLANGHKSQTVTLNQQNNFTHTFEALDYLDDRGEQIEYTLQEDEYTGYVFSILKTESVEDGKLITVENKHTPERITIKGTKKWEKDTPDVRPNTITLKILANGDVIDKRTFSGVQGENTWSYTIDNLFKYDKGQVINYTIEEEGADDYYLEKDPTNAYNLKNIYHPYGNLLIKKTVENANEHTRIADFVLTLQMTNRTTKKSDKNVYHYTTSLGRQGEVTNGSRITIKQDEIITIQNISTSTRVTIVEEDKAGYTLTNPADLNAISIQSKQDKEVNIINKYTSKADYLVRAKKILEGTELQAYQFVFDIIDRDTQKVVRAASNLKNGEVVFGKLQYTQDDVGKTFRYKLKERNKQEKGIDYDTAEIDFDVTLTENGDGTITVNSTFPRDIPTFRNRYVARGELNLTAYKKIKGNLPIQAGAYSFELALKDTPNQVVARGTNDKAGLITFDTIQLSNTDIGTTKVYVAREVEGNDTQHIIYDKSTIEYAVTVYDNGDGTLGSNVVISDKKVDDYGNEETEPYFVNEYKPGNLKISKFTTDGNTDKEFTFKLKLSGDEQILPKTLTGNYGEATLAPDSTLSPVTPTAITEVLPSPRATSSVNSTGASFRSAGAYSSGTSFRSATAGADSNGPVYDIELDSEGLYTSHGKSIRPRSGTMPNSTNVRYTLDSKGTLRIYASGPNPVIENELARLDFNRDIYNVVFMDKIRVSINFSFSRRRDIANSTIDDILFGALDNLYVADLRKIELKKGGSFLKGWFKDSKNLRKLDMRGVDLTTINSLQDFLSNANKLVALLGHEDFDLSNIFDAENAFDNTPHIKYDVRKWNLAKLRFADYMFGHRTDIPMGFESLSFPGVTSLPYWFGYSELTKPYDVTRFRSFRVLDLYNSFSNLTADLHLDGLDVSQVTSALNTFTNWRPTTLPEKYRLDLSSWIFSGLRNSISLQNFYPNSVTLGFIGLPVIPVESTNVPHPRALEFSIPAVYKAYYKGKLSIPLKAKDKDYTGRYIRKDRSYGPYTLEEFTREYEKNPAALAGEWEFERTPQESTLHLYKNDGTDTKKTIKVPKSYELDLTTYAQDVTATELSQNIFSRPGYILNGFSRNRYSTASNEDLLFGPPKNRKRLRYKGRIGTEESIYAIWEPKQSNYTIDNNEITFTLRGGESINFELPAGVNYEVYEEVPGRWLLQNKENDKGVIQSTEETVASFINKPTNEDKAVIEFSGRKLLDGRPAGGFSFDATKDGRIPVGGATSDDNGFISFPPIEFTSQDVGTHQYRISERVDSDEYTYDTTTYIATVTVSYSRATGLTADVSYSNGNENDIDMVFNNATKKGSLTIAKNIEDGNESFENKEFNLRIIVGDKIFNKTIRAGQTITLDNLPVGSEYTVQETDIPKGFSLKNVVNGTGTIEQGNTNVEVINTYNALGQLTIPVKKILKNKKLKEGQFKFELKNDRQEVISEYTNEEDGTVLINIPLRKEGTSTYTISEKRENERGIAYDETVYTVTVRSKLSQDGTKLIGEVVDFPDDGYIFTNTYNPPPFVIEDEGLEDGFGSVLITKEVTNKTQALEDKEYTFTINLSLHDAPLDDEEYTATSDIRGEFTIRHGQTISIKAGEKIKISPLPEHTVVEITENVPVGFRLDTTKSITRETVESRVIKNLKLVNIYQANGEILLTGKKILHHASVNDYVFNFLILKDKRIVARGVNNGETITFDSIRYTEQDSGQEYTYEIVEEKGDDFDIKYDSSIKNIRVRIEDNGEGKLTPVLLTENSDEITFENYYIHQLPSTGSQHIFTLVLLGLLTLSGALVILKRKK